MIVEFENRSGEMEQAKWKLTNRVLSAVACSFRSSSRNPIADTVVAAVDSSLNP